MHSVLIRNGLIRNTSEIFEFLKKRLKSTLQEMIQNICGSLDVNTKYFFRYMFIFFFDKICTDSHHMHTRLIGEKIGQYFAARVETSMG